MAGPAWPKSKHNTLRTSLYGNLRAEIHRENLHRETPPGVSHLQPDRHDVDGVVAEGEEFFVCSGDNEVDGEGDDLGIVLDGRLAMGVMEELGDSDCEGVELGFELFIGALGVLLTRRILGCDAQGIGTTTSCSTPNSEPGKSKVTSPVGFKSLGVFSPFLR